MNDMTNLTTPQKKKLLKDIAKDGMKFNADEIRDDLQWDEESISVSLTDAGYENKITSLWMGELDTVGRIEITNTRIPIYVFVGGTDSLHYFVSLVAEPLIAPQKIFDLSPRNRRAELPNTDFGYVGNMEDDEALDAVVFDVGVQMDFADLVDVAGGNFPDGRKEAVNAAIEEAASLFRESPEINNLFEYLYTRWNDEKDHENIADYVLAMQKEWPHDIEGMTKRPFGFTYLQDKDGHNIRVTVFIRSGDLMVNALPV
tara:strand:- start:268 stop:1041 length:774 start_codon:yes stop_codon:yes gene_type:complete